jgi:hypothetical protein
LPTVALELENLAWATSASRPAIAFRLEAHARLADVGDDPMRRQIHQRSGGLPEATRQKGQVAPIVPTEVVKEQVGRREDRDEEPDRERHHEERDDEDEDEDRQRRTYQEPDEADSRDLDGAGGIRDSGTGQPSVLLESVSG